MRWIAILLCVFCTELSAEPVPVSCAPREEMAAKLLAGKGETSVFEGAAPKGVIEVFARVDGSWTLVVVSPDGTACVVAAGDIWRGFMLPQGEAG